MNPNVPIKVFSAGGDPMELYMIGVLLFGIAVAIVHLGFAVGVASDIRRHAAEGRFAFGGGAFLWFLATLLGGVFVAGVYWVMTYSMFNPRIAAAINNRGPRVAVAAKGSGASAPDTDLERGEGNVPGNG